MLDSSGIYSLYIERKKQMGPYHAAASVLMRVYDGEYEVDLPELSSNEEPATANLIQTGLDQHAMRISSVMPTIMCPSLRPSKTSLKRANQRRLALQAWWHMNKLPLILPKRARYLAGLGMSPVLIRPGPDGYPLWEVKNPLDTFPAPGEEMVPLDCLFHFERTVRWLNARYPAFAQSYGKTMGHDEKCTLLQYVSDDQFALVVIGRDDKDGDPPTLMLGSTPNRAERPLVICPGRITLGKMQGQFDQLVGTYATQNKLWALQIHAVMREVFGETWAQATAQGGVPVIDREANPYDGTVGIVRDGQIQQFRVQSSQGPNQAIDRLERNQRLTGAIPAEMGGESASNIRTGRRGGQVFSAAVDFYVAEHQNILAASLEEEDKAGIAVAKGWWPDTPKTFLIPLAKGQVSYTPNVTFETDAHSVSYAYAGSDVNQLVVGGGQRVAQGTMSKKSFMGIDPWVTDVDSEHDLIVAEQLEQAILQSILQQAAMPDGPWTPAQLGRLAELVYVQDKELWEAIAILEREAQEAQEAEVAPGGVPSQPGLAMAGAPGTPQAAIPSGGNESQMNLNQLLFNLKSPQRGMPS